VKSHTPKGQNTREHIVIAAEKLFATRGFHGTSTRDVAAAAYLPLASLVYHFARKEKLYAAVLEAINADLLAALDRAGLVDAIVDWAIARPDRVKLLLRELLDNPVRVQTAAKLPLAPFLQRAVAALDVPSPELAVLHLVGGISYVAAAWPTVTRIIGSPRAKLLAAGYRQEAHAFAARILGKAGHERRAAALPGEARPRPPRAQDDRRGSRAVVGAGRRVSG
jgi:AcrR family transcriptional regulator